MGGQTDPFQYWHPLDTPGCRRKGSGHRCTDKRTSDWWTPSQLGEEAGEGLLAHLIDPQDRPIAKLGAGEYESLPVSHHTLLDVRMFKGRLLCG